MIENYLEWPENVDGLCKEDLKSRSGKEHWGNWCPKIGLEGIIVHMWEDKERRLVKFNEHYGNFFYLFFCVLLFDL